MNLSLILPSSTRVDIHKLRLDMVKPIRLGREEMQRTEEEEMGHATLDELDANAPPAINTGRGKVIGGSNNNDYNQQYRQQHQDHHRNNYGTNQGGRSPNGADGRKFNRS